MSDLRTMPSEEIYIGTANELIVCPSCSKRLAVKSSAKAFEGDWVNCCWSCGFMWTSEVDFE